MIIDVDGEPVRVCGGPGPRTPEEHEAFAEVIRAARAQLEGVPARCMERDAKRPALPCLREPDHEPPHKTGTGRTW